MIPRIATCTGQHKPAKPEHNSAELRVVLNIISEAQTILGLAIPFPFNSVSEAKYEI